MPAANETLDQKQHEQLRAALIRRWKRFVLVCIVLILISGAYNAYYSMGGKPTIYHALFGVKFLAALGVFFVASVLVGSAEAFAPMRANARKWLGVLIALAAAIVLISGYMKQLPAKTASDEEGHTALRSGGATGPS